MSLKERYKKKKKRLDELRERGQIRTEQIRAEKLRKKKEQQKYMEPGTFRYAITTKQHVLDFMKDVKERREERRKEKQSK